MGPIHLYTIGIPDPLDQDPSIDGCIYSDVVFNLYLHESCKAVIGIPQGRLTKQWPSVCLYHLHFYKAANEFVSCHSFLELKARYSQCFHWIHG